MQLCFTPRGCWCCGAAGGPCRRGPRVPLARYVTLAAFCSTRSALRSQLGVSLNHSLGTQALAGLVLAGCCLWRWDSGVILEGSSADLGGSCEMAELLLTRWEFLREHPEGEKHRFCLLCWLNLARMQSQEATQLQGKRGQHHAGASLHCLDPLIYSDLFG